MPPVSKELKEKMSVDIGNLRTFLKAMISSDPLFQGFYIYLVAYICPLETDEEIEKRKTKQKYL